MKKDPFWIIAGIIAGVTIVAGGGFSYLKVSRYLELQNIFQQENKSMVEKLKEAKNTGELPTDKWQSEINEVKTNLKEFFKALEENISSLKSPKDSGGLKSKYSEFFTKLAEQNGFDISKYLLETIGEKDILEAITKLDGWLNSLATQKENKPLTPFGKWYSEFGKKILEGPGYQEKEDEVSFLLDLNSEYKRNFPKLYTTLDSAIKEVKSYSLGGDEASRENALNKFNLDYKALIPSLLLSRYLVDNIPEFNNVTLKSIYIPSLSPVRLGFIKNHKDIKDASGQVTLCFCFLGQEQFTKPAKTFSCNPDRSKVSLSGDAKKSSPLPQAKVFVMDSLTSRFWNMTRDDEIKDPAKQKSYAEIENSFLPQFRLFPKELGTTIPIAFYFSSSYKNFSNLLKAFYKLNDKKEDGKNIFEPLGIGIPVPIVVTKILFKLNNNIPSDYFKLGRKQEEYPQDKEKEWAEMEKKLIEEKIENLKNDANKYFDFFIEVLIYLYDPEGLAECWKNIPTSTGETVSQASSGKS